jgi:hypothetical protein
MASHDFYFESLYTKVTEKHRMSNLVILGIIAAVAFGACFIVLPASANTHHIHRDVHRDINLREAGTYEIGYGIEISFKDPLENR